MAAGRAKPWLQVDVAESTKSRLFAMFALERAESLVDARLLDFGCGGGRYMRIFSEKFQPSNIYGVDVDDGGLAALREEGFHCSKLDERTPRLTYPDSYFRFVFSSNVIEHIPRSRYLDYLAEIHRVLEPGGHFVLGAPNYPFKRLYDMQTAWRMRRDRSMRDYYLFDDPTHVNFVNVMTVERDLRRAGFQELSFTTGSLPFLDTFSLFRRETVRRRLRVIGYKFIGSCRKPGMKRPGKRLGGA